MMNARKMLTEIAIAALCVTVTAVLGFTAIESSFVTLTPKCFAAGMLLMAEAGIIRQIVLLYRAASAAEEMLAVIEEAVRIDAEQKRAAGKSETAEACLRSGPRIEYIP